MASTTIIDKVDSALSRYYKSLNTTYDNIFKNFCVENGIDADLMRDEMEGDPEGCMLVEFDQENFPFDEEPETEEDKTKFIFDIIKQCYKSPDKLFDNTLPKIDEQLFKDIGEEQISHIKGLYKKQCPTIFYRGMDKDHNLLLVLAVQYKHPMDFLLNLVDTFDRARVDKINEVTDYKVNNWINDSDHVKKRKKMKIKTGQQDATYADVCKHALESFAKRCCDGLIFNAVVKIDDSLERIVKYVYASAVFIQNLIKTNKMNLLPFQMDVVIAEGEPVRTTTTDSTDDGKNVDDDEDESDEEDDQEANDNKPGPFHDYVGDIEAKLKQNKLPYVKQQLNVDSDDYKDQRIFSELFKKFQEDNEIKDNSYLSHKRVIALIDRRTSKNKDDIDDIYFYPAVAGKYTRDIPKDAVPEWGISASHTCLLPNMNYNVKEEIGEPNTSPLNKDEEKKGKSPSEDINVTTKNHCKGGVLTFSFHARSEDKLRMQLYFNGQSIRCLPTDLKDVLPRLFVENDTNKQYKNAKELDEIIQDLETKFVDPEFKAFLQC